MTRLTAVLGLAALASCTPPGPYHLAEGYSDYYKPRADETKGPERVWRREIVHWASNPRDKKRIGFLYRYEVQPKGSRDVRSCYYIYDRYGVKPIGFITDEGVFYRFNEQGRFDESTKVGDFTVQMTGLKVFFDIPLRENVDLEEVDPYK